MPEKLDDGIRERAYLCGRLLAVYEGLQEAVYELQTNQRLISLWLTVTTTWPPYRPG